MPCWLFASGDRHLDCFCLLTITNQAVIHIAMKFSGDPLIISQGCLPSGTIAAQTVALDLVVWQTLTLAFAPTEIRGSSVYRALFLFAVTEHLDGIHPSKHGCSSQLFWAAFPSRVTNCLFLSLLATCVSIEKYLCKSYANFPLIGVQLL